MELSDLQTPLTVEKGKHGGNYMRYLLSTAFS